MIELQNTTYGYGPREVLVSIDASLAAGELVALVGPNGAGKSTLLTICAGLRRDYRGTCRFEGREVREWPRRELARSVAFVPQSLEVVFPFTAEQVVLMGRSPFGDGMFETEEDLSVAARAMELTDCVDLRGREFRTLSGGERQRVILAAALAQKPRVLLLDEPASFLDLRHQIGLYRLLSGLRDQGALIVSVTHDLNLASSYADRVLVLREGRLYADGPPQQVLGAASIRDVFGVECTLLPRDESRSWIAYDR